MILNTSTQVGAYRSYTPNLLHMYLIREGPIEKIRLRRSDGEDLIQKIRWRRWLTLEPIMTLIPYKMREEENTFLY